jgi:hypothetical protein
MTAKIASMSKKTSKSGAGEIGRIRVVEDFLPAPADLVPREDNVKVTLSLSLDNRVRSYAIVAHGSFVPD